MSTARDAILASVRTALCDAPPPEPVPRTYRRSSAAGVDVLVDRLRDYGADLRRLEARDLTAAIAGVCDGRRIAVPPGLPQAWRPGGAVVDEGLTPRELDELDGAVTGCTIAIAETGTLVLAGGETEGRRALTLVPDLHVCVVLGSQVVDTVPAAFERLESLVREQRQPVTFISGPSATSDIELSRVEGVHGPRRLVALVVADHEEERW